MATVFSCFRLVWIAALSAIFTASAVQAQYVTTVPDGFEDLDQVQNQLVDVVFEGQLIGIFEIAVDRETITFRDASLLIEALPPELRNDRVRDALSGPLDRNLALACPRNATSQNCGYIAPDIAGVIHYTDRFEIQLFVNAALRAKSTVPVYLPKPSGELNVVSYGSFLASGGGVDDRLRLSADLDTNISAGDKRFLSTLTYTDQNKLQIDEAVGEIDAQGYRVAAGLLWSRAGAGYERRRLLGLSVSSQVDTRLDKDRLLGTPLTVYLQTRAKVEVYLNDRVLFAQTLPAGSNQIDTSAFPQGNYELSLRVSEIGRPPRTETRFFSKSQTMPQIGAPVFFAEAGIDQPLFEGQISSIANEQFLSRAGTIVRLDQSLAVGAAAQFGGNELEARAVAAIFNENLTLELIGGAGSKGSKLFSLSLASAGWQSFNYSMDARYVRDESEGPRGSIFRLGEYARANGTVSWTHEQLRLSIIGNLLKLSNRSDYSIATNAQYDLIRQKNMLVSLVAEHSKSSIGDSWALGVTLRMFASSHGAESAVGFSTDAFGQGENADGIYSIHSLNGAMDVGDSGQLSGLATYEVGPNIESLSGALEMNARSFALNGSFLRNVGGNQSASQYALGASTALIFSGEGVSAGNRGTRDGSLLVNVEGAMADEKFELLVNGQLQTVIGGGESKLIVLPSYRAYQLRIRPIRSRPMTIVDSVRNVSLYPGNVREIVWHVARRVAVIGQLVTDGGQPIPNATLRWEKEVAVTDEAGYFQIETAPSAEIDVHPIGGGHLQFQMPEFDDSLDFIRIGPVTFKQSKEGM